MAGLHKTGPEESKAPVCKAAMVLLCDRDGQSLCGVPAVLLLRPVPAKGPAKRVKSERRNRDIKMSQNTPLIWYSANSEQ